MAALRRASPMLTAATWALRSPLRSQPLAHVGEEDLEDVVVEDAAAEDAEGGDADAFFEVGAGAGVEGAGEDAADVRPVGGGGGEGDEGVLVEDGLDEVDVVAVGAGDVGVVDEVDVAVVHVFEADGADDFRDGELGDADEGGEVELALGDELAEAVVDGGGEVVALVDDGGVGGLDDDERHFVADGAEGVAQDFEGDGVDGGLDGGGGHGGASRRGCSSDGGRRISQLAKKAESVGRVPM